MFKRFWIRLEEERALRRMRARADRVMVAVCWVLWAASLGFACIYGEWLVALTVGTSAALLATFVAWAMPGRATTRLIMAVLFIVFPRC